jgi:hypothetical protein
VGNFDQTLREGRGGNWKREKRQEMGLCFSQIGKLNKVPGEKINTYWNVEPSE